LFSGSATAKKLNQGADKEEKPVPRAAFLYSSQPRSSAHPILLSSILEGLKINPPRIFGAFYCLLTGPTEKSVKVSILSAADALVLYDKPF